MLPPTPVKKKPAPSPSPKSVEKASNPIALRYWNQCTTDRKISEPALMPRDHAPMSSDVPPWATADTHLTTAPPSQGITKARTPTTFPVRVPDITKRVRSESVPRFCNFDNEPVTCSNISNCNENKVEVIKILSTAGTGIKRDNEKKEALGNINRFITMDKMKKDDATRAANDKAREVQMKEVKIETIKDDKSYLQVKQEQIQLSNERTHFLNNGANARIPKSPEPFRGNRHRDMSEPRQRQHRPEPPREKPPAPLTSETNGNHHKSQKSSHHAQVASETVSNGNKKSREKQPPPAPVTSETVSNGNNNKLNNIMSEIRNLNDDEKRKIFLALFNEMSFSSKSGLMADILLELKPASQVSL